MVIQAELLHLAKHRRSTVLHNRSTRGVMGPKPGGSARGWGEASGGAEPSQRTREGKHGTPTKWGSSLREALLEVEM